MLYTNLIPPASVAKQPDNKQPDKVLVFLHGLLGDGSDWNGVVNELTDFSILTVDLPGHGKSRDIACEGFEHCCELIQHAVLSALSGPASVFLIGYSLGARICMFGLTQGCFEKLAVSGCILEGGNFGLGSEAEKQTRLANDQQWAERFEYEPIEQVLFDWYHQPVFSSLNLAQIEASVKKRSHNQGRAVAKMLIATSLARQPYLLNDIKSNEIPVHYLCGEKDHKFSGLAEKCGLSFTRVEDAGHNAHDEQPSRYAVLIRTLVTQIQRR